MGDLRRPHHHCEAIVPTMVRPVVVPAQGPAKVSSAEVDGMLPGRQRDPRQIGRQLAFAQGRDLKHQMVTVHADVDRPGVDRHGLLVR